MKKITERIIRIFAFMAAWWLICDLDICEASKVFHSLNKSSSHWLTLWNWWLMHAQPHALTKNGIVLYILCALYRSEISWVERRKHKIQFQFKFGRRVALDSRGENGEWRKDWRDKSGTVFWVFYGNEIGIFTAVNKKWMAFSSRVQSNNNEKKHANGFEIDSLFLCHRKCDKKNSFFFDYCCAHNVHKKEINWTKYPL